MTISIAELKKLSIAEQRSPGLGFEFAWQTRTKKTP